MAKAYDRIWVQGVVLNRRTHAAYQQANRFLTEFHNVNMPQLMQGSYNTTVSQSAGTHNGGGAIDTRYIGKKNKVVISVCREVGFAIWYRPELWIGGQKEWDDHNHGILIGDREMSDGARKQVQDYFAGLNGLASHARDPFPRPNPIPRFIFPLGSVDLSNVRKEAMKTRGWNSYQGVKLVQRALNVKSGTDLPVDGIFGPRTRKAFGRYEIQVGGDGDGIPGEFALSHLGLSRFNVKA